MLSSNASDERTFRQDLYASWIDGLKETEFHEAALPLLQASGFFDIHYTHGPYEFGKDIIAKSTLDDTVFQYGIQCKMGDCGGPEWERIVGQLEELIDSYLAHPNYDQNLNRRHVLWITGRLKGKAVVSARQFAERVRVRGNQEFGCGSFPTTPST